MREQCRRLVDSPVFHNAILLIIMVNAAIMGAETHRPWLEQFALAFRVTHWVVQIIFIFEIIARMIAAKSLRDFFADGWNFFDFIVVAAGLIPAAGEYATVARLARVLRVARLVEVIPDLKLIIGTMLRSIRSMGNVVIMLGFLLYAYAIIGYHMFGEVDPENWGTLMRAMWTLFQTLTLEGWVEKQKLTADVRGTALFYGSFLVIATYVVMNLFVAIVVNNLQEMKAEQQEEFDHAHPQAELLDRVEFVIKELQAFEKIVRKQKGDPAKPQDS